jgi:Fur family ferric uptake transcriptional regulator
MNYELYLKTLKKHRLRGTTERKELFSLLLAQKSPPTVAQLVKAAEGFADRSTVYRTLELFEKIGVSIRVYTGWKYKVELSDTYSHHHHHMLCTNCDAIISFEESDGFMHELKKLENEYAFKATSHSLELQGLCQACCSSQN